ncbi:transglycosylase SLT domain-containing protein [Bartonella vinsonii]|uniref:Lytic transglycosylase n=1 Tax=Bartonella vinsonii subsp. berkhoffii str. Tweed TaxID=1094502 RepID=N6UNS9_BARVB|nr:transglycosylase SLT domain-containing protein [Bartonella vinsonii]ENN93984.1 lytic transglycosylase [Bartonella vinsonii subsp. berkhoffii str. Tweed]
MINFHPNVKHAISQAAQKYGLPESFLERVALIESNGNPHAKNKNSSAGGLYQFLDSTAKHYQLNNKFDPFQATDAMARLTKDNIRYLATALGREPSEAELYLAHQQGPAGAVKLIKNPHMPASQLLGRQAVILNGGNSEATAGDFMNHIYGLYNKMGAPSKRTIQQSQGNGQAAPNEVGPLRGFERLQKTIQGGQWAQGDQVGNQLMAYDTPFPNRMMAPESRDNLTGQVMETTPLQTQGINSNSLKKGFAGLLHLMRESGERQNQQMQLAQQQMLQQPVMAGFSQSSGRPMDLTPLIDSSKRQSGGFYGRQKEEQLREELLRRTGAYHV